MVSHAHLGVSCSDKCAVSQGRNSAVPAFAEHVSASTRLCATSTSQPRIISAFAHPSTSALTAGTSVSNSIGRLSAVGEELAGIPYEIAVDAPLMHPVGTPPDKSYTVVYERRRTRLLERAVAAITKVLSAGPSTSTKLRSPTVRSKWPPLPTRA